MLSNFLRRPMLAMLPPMILQVHSPPYSLTFPKMLTFATFLEPSVLNPNAIKPTLSTWHYNSSPALLDLTTLRNVAEFLNHGDNVEALFDDDVVSTWAWNPEDRGGYRMVEVSESGDILGNKKVIMVGTAQSWMALNKIDPPNSEYARRDGAVYYKLGFNMPRGTLWPLKRAVEACPTSAELKLPLQFKVTETAVVCQAESAGIEYSIGGGPYPFIFDGSVCRLDHPVIWPGPAIPSHTINEYDPIVVEVMLHVYDFSKKGKRYVGLGGDLVNVWKVRRNATAPNSPATPKKRSRTVVLGENDNSPSPSPSKRRIV